MRWFKLYPQKWLLGSTRFELSIEQRAVFVDFLALASLHDPPGEFVFYSIEQLATQFQVSVSLVESTIKRCVETKKIEFFPKKNRTVIKNWKKYQSEYDRQKPYRSREKANNKVTTSDVSKLPLEGEEEEKRKEVEVEEKERKREKGEGEPSLPKQTFFSLLKSFPSYPFQEKEDEPIFEHFSNRIDLIEQTQKKIAWWKENLHALNSSKKNPRQQLIEFLLQEVDFRAERR
jgi:hypothetical protein